MMKKNTPKKRTCWSDLDAWRTKHGLNVPTASTLLGLGIERWRQLQQNPAAPLEDAAVGMLLAFYERYPEHIPLTRSADFAKFMNDLGYDINDSVDKKRCASALGREGVAAYRWLEGRPLSKPVERLIEAFNRLPVLGEEKRDLLESLARQEGESRGVPDPLNRASWRSNESKEEE